MADEEHAPEGAAIDEAQKSSQVQEDLDEEPTGDGPDETRGRKEYRLRKQIEGELKREREKVIALDARVSTLSEMARRPAEQPAAQPEQAKRFSSSEAWAKVDAGEWSREQASEYIADTRFILNREKEKTEERAAREVLEPVKEAQKEALEYVALLPSLKDRSHPKFKEIETEVGYLLEKRRVRTLIEAEALAMRSILGPIDQIKERQRMSNARPGGDFHVETRGGGGHDAGPGGKKDPYADIPDFTKQLWERTNTSAKDREIEAKYYRERVKTRGR